LLVTVALWHDFLKHVQLKHKKYEKVSDQEDVLLQVEELEARIAPDGGGSIQNAEFPGESSPPTDRAKPPTLPWQAEAYRAGH
jgi:hypothetical protein